jgi:hypothetical protein
LPVVQAGFDFPIPSAHRSRVHRVAAIIAILWVGALGAGAVEYAHNLEHAHHDSDTHDESNCPTHLQLHLGLLLPAWIPLLISLGLLVAFISEVLPPNYICRIPARIDCRGPPRAS